MEMYTHLFCKLLASITLHFFLFFVFYLTTELSYAPPGCKERAVEKQEDAASFLSFLLIAALVMMLIRLLLQLALKSLLLIALLIVLMTRLLMKLALKSLLLIALLILCTVGLIDKEIE